jgi:hypothetical protein
MADYFHPKPADHDSFAFVADRGKEIVLWIRLKNQPALFRQFQQPVEYGSAIVV